VAGGGGSGGEPRGTEASAGADEDEIEVIRCICNIYRDEGLMIQCDSCEVCDIGPVSHGFSPPPLTICPNTFEWCILPMSTYSTMLAPITRPQSTTGAESEVQAVARREDGVVTLTEGTSEIMCLKMLRKRSQERAAAHFDRDFIPY